MCSRCSILRRSWSSAISAHRQLHLGDLQILLTSIPASRDVWEHTLLYGVEPAMHLRHVKHWHRRDASSSKRISRTTVPSDSRFLLLRRPFSCPVSLARCARALLIVYPRCAVRTAAALLCAVLLAPGLHSDLLAASALRNRGFLLFQIFATRF